MKRHNNRRYLLRCVWQLTQAVTLTSIMHAADSNLDTRRPWDVETSINLRYFVRESGLIAQQFVDAPAKFLLPSPDGRKFAILTRKGDLAADESRCSIIIYDTEAVSIALAAGRPLPGPTRTLVHASRSASMYEGIVSADWSTTGDGIFFTSANRQDSSQGATKSQYFGDVHTGVVTWLCDGERRMGASLEGLSGRGLVDYRGGRSLYVDFVEPNQPAEHAVKRTYPAQVWNAELLQRYSESDAGSLYGAKGPVLGLFTEVHGIRKLIRSLPDTDGHQGIAPISGSINPTANRAVLQLPATATSQERWANRYETTVGSPRAGATAKSLQQFWMVDFDTGEQAPLLDAPVGTATGMGSPFGVVRPNAIWAADAKTVVLVNCALPLEKKKEGEGDAWILEYNLDAGSVTRITPVQEGNQIVTAVRQQSGDRELVVTWKSKDRWYRADEIGTECVYERVGSSWKRSAQGVASSTGETTLLSWQEPPDQFDLLKEQGRARGDQYQLGSWLDYPSPLPYKCSNGLKVTLQEGPNDPQRIVAALGEHKAVLIDRETDLDGVEIAHSQIIEWKSKDGQLHRGLLTLPPGERKSPPPLVIIQYHYMPNVFRPDGGNVGGEAQQALAARGMATLQVSLDDTLSVMRPTTEDKQSLALREEIDRTADNIDSAVEMLAKKNLIDPERIGMQGFSRGGYQTRSLLVYPLKHRLRATVANDGFDPSLAFVLYATVLEQMTGPETTGGKGYGGPFWEQKARWGERAIDLAANRASGAHLEIKHDCGESKSIRWPITYVWVAGALRSAGRPVEYVTITGAVHSLQRPQHRYASLSANVDWLDFWLTGHERTEVCAAAGETAEILKDKYARWRQLRACWERQQAWEAAGHPAGSVPDANPAKS